MKTTENKISFFIYARKSSESDERQVQSIDDQETIMRGIAASREYNVIDVFSEAKSAKAPYMRPEFDKMMERIHKGEAKGILVWKLDRLARNPIDSGTIQWLLQEEIIKLIVASDRDYRPEDNALVFSVESSMANQYVRDLSRNVKRGLDSKLKKGWMPGSAALGYLNSKTEARGENFILKDPERFPLLRKAWDLMLSGNYLPPAILNKLNNEWGFRTRPTKRKGGKPMSKSTIYRIFTNPFYAGIVYYSGQHVPGKHDPMVTLEEFDRVQVLLGKKGKPRHNRYSYAFTGMIKCGECGGLVSATYKEKVIKKTNEVRAYTLYYCIGAQRSAEKCRQSSYTNVSELEDIIGSELLSITILPVFKDWALDIIEELRSFEVQDDTKTLESNSKACDGVKRKIENLTQLRLSDMIDDEEFVSERQRLKKELALLQAKAKEAHIPPKDWLQLTADTFHFATYAYKAFLFGDDKTKREILTSLSCLNCILIDKKLSIHKAEWFTAISEHYLPMQAKFEALEPEKMLTTQGQKEVFDLFRPQVRALVDAVRTTIEAYDGKIPIHEIEPPSET